MLGCRDRFTTHFMCVGGGREVKNAPLLYVGTASICVYSFALPVCNVEALLGDV